MKLKELREEAHLTQAELAKAIGNVQRNISNWENGASEPDIATILRLADVLGVTVDELLGREEAPPTLYPNGDFSYDLSREIMIESRWLDLEQQEKLLGFIRAVAKKK